MFNISPSDIALASVKQGSATQRFLETAVLDHGAYHKQNADRLGEAHKLLTSMERQDRVLYGLVEKQAIKSEQKQQKIEHLLMSTQETLATMTDQSDHLVDMINKGYITVNKHVCDIRSPDRNPRIAAEQESARYKAHSASRLSHLSEQLDLLLKSKHPLDPSSKPQALTPYARSRLRDPKEINLDRFTEVQCLALRILALKGLEYLQRALRLYPQLLILFWGLCQTIPASMSSLLSDNVTILDILDRKHSVQYEHFRHSAVLKAMLLAKFEDTPGLEKIRAGQFSLHDPKYPDKSIDLGDWDHFVRPRARFVMTIHYSAVKMSNKCCAKCNGSVVEFRPNSWMCSKCSISFRTPPRLQPEESFQTDITCLLDHPLQRTKPHGNGLIVPARNGGRGDERHWLEAFRSSLSDAQICETQSRGSSRLLDLEVPLEPESLRLSGQQSQEGTPTQPAASDEQLGGFLAKPLDELADEKSIDHAAPTSVKMERESMRKLEAAELQYFKRVRIQEDSTIYDAALAGNYEAVEVLLDITTHVDGLCGPWGTPLTAAVISDSSAVVQLLLEHGANPLLHDGPLGTPLRVSVLRGQDDILNDLLMASFNHSTDPKSATLTSIMSSVLFTATMYNRMSSAEILLMHGADPFSNYGGQLSAFLNAVAMSIPQFVELFLRYAASRRLLSCRECLYALGALGRDCPEPFLHLRFSKPHFFHCCAEMCQRRGRMMQQLIHSRIDADRGYDFNQWFIGWDGESLLLHSIKKRRAAGRMDESRIKDEVDSGPSASTHAPKLQIPDIQVSPIITPSRFPSGNLLGAGGSSGRSFGWYCGHCYHGPMTCGLEVYCDNCQRRRDLLATYGQY